MSTPQGVVDQIQNEVRSIAGIKLAYPVPPDQLGLGAGPVAVAWVESSTYSQGPAGQMIGIHVVRLQVHVSRRDLQYDVREAQSFGKSVPNELFSADKGRAAAWIAQIETINSISAVFGPMAWGTAETVGWNFQVNLKTRDDIS